MDGWMNLLDRTLQPLILLHRSRLLLHTFSKTLAKPLTKSFSTSHYQTEVCIGMFLCVGVCVLHLLNDTSSSLSRQIYVVATQWCIAIANCELFKGRLPAGRERARDAEIETVSPQVAIGKRARGSEIRHESTTIGEKSLRHEAHSER